MSQEFTVKDLAARLAACTGSPAELHARQVRHWAQNGLFAFEFVHPRGEGPTAAFVYSERHLAAARIYVLLGSMGYTIEELLQVSRLLLNAPQEFMTREVSDGALHLWSTGITAAVERVKRGDRKVYFFFHANEAGKIGLFGGFDSELRPNDLIQGVAPLTVVITVADLFGRLFSTNDSPSA